MPFLASLPEELLERILSFCVIAATQATQFRPTWHTSKTLAARSYTRLAPLLVCKTFYRIALPQYYHTIHLMTPQQSSCLRILLHHRTHIARYVRTLVISSISDDTPQTLQLCTSLAELDITLDPYISQHQSNAFSEALHGLCAITSLTLRKQHNIYLTMPSVRQFMTRISGAISHWPALTNVHLAFRISDGDGPVAAIVQALAYAPALRTFSTELPSLWNEMILRISENPRVEKIVFGLSAEGRTAGGGLYMAQARKHPRLAELIKNGTPIIRGRACTMVVPPKMVASSLSQVTKRPAASRPPFTRHSSLKRGGRFY